MSPQSTDGLMSEDQDARAALSILEADDIAPVLTPEKETPEPEGEEPETPETPEEQEEPKDEEIEPEPTPVGDRYRPTVKEIQAKYPNILKDFPGIKDLIYRDQAFHEVFATVEEAKQGKDDAQSFQNLRSLVTSGTKENFQEFLTGVNAEKGALRAMAANFLPSLHEVNKDLYFQVTQPVAETLLRNAYRTGAAGNENLQNAALVLAQWAFGDAKYATGELKSESIQLEEKPKDSEFEREKQQFYAERYNDAQGYVTSNARTRLRAEIARGFDPNNAFKEYTRNLLINQIVEEVGTQLSSNKQHMDRMNGLWKAGYAARYSGDWKDRILNTYLSGARPLIAAVRQRVRSAALGEAIKSSESQRQQAEKSGDRREVRGSGSSGQPGPRRVPAAKEIDWGKTSDMDILEDKITLKKR